MEILNIGSKGPFVGFIQYVLRGLGYYSGEITYEYGQATKGAVRSAQQALGIPADGIVGRMTREAFLPYFTGNYVYTTASGDTFYSIALKTGVALDRLLAANPLSQPQQLVAGQKIIIPYKETVVPTTLSYSHEIMELNLLSLTQRYPFLVYGVAGESVLGKSIPFIRFGNGEKVLVYNASHHANEWINTVIMMKFIEDLSIAYVSGKDLAGADITDIFKTASIYILPMVNPDGVDLVTGALDPESSAYKYARSISRTDVAFPSGWKANIEGTDLNLNYPAGWENARRIKAEAGVTSPGPRDYVGPYPFSAPESRAMAQFTVNTSPRLTLAYHSAGRIIYWKYLDFQPVGSFEIAQAFGRVSGYSVETTPVESGYAGYKDWFIQEYDRPGYTIETGIGPSPIPLEQFPEIYEENLGILVSAPLLI